MSVIVQPVAAIGARPLQTGGRTLRMGLVNNMADGGLVSAERQFLSLLSDAAAGMRVTVDFFSLPGIERGADAQKHMATQGYGSIDDIFTAKLDGVIVTGAEPKMGNLRNETYWKPLTQLFDWIERDGPSALFSCLAAHAAVLHYDGIERRRLAQKKIGVFQHYATATHAPGKIDRLPYRIVHSRWNELLIDDLQAHGYSVLTQAADAGVDIFVKRSRNLLAFFQGHPEYDGASLSREYQRDVKRYLTGEQEFYPSFPVNYYSAEDTKLLELFRRKAMAARDVRCYPSFPVISALRLSKTVNRSYPAAFVRSWLLQLAPARAQSPAAAPARYAVAS